MSSQGHQPEGSNRSKRKYAEVIDVDGDSTAEIAANDIPVKTLDPEGDVIIFVGNKKWLASSKVLSLASPVFSRMFAPNFKEGIQVRNGETPTVELKEDNDKIMDEILSMLHHQAKHIPLSITPNHALNLAIHSDKYDCRAALRPWSSHWIRELGNQFVHNMPLGRSLYATYLLDRDSLPDLAAKAVKYTAPRFPSDWRKWKLGFSLPETFIEAISQRVTDGLGRLHEEIARSEKNLRSDDLETKKCMSCSKQECNKAYLISEYFNVMRRHGIWPSYVPFTKQSMNTIFMRIQKASNDQKHECAACPDCPLRRELKALHTRAKGIVDELKPVPLGIPEEDQAA